MKIFTSKLLTACIIFSAIPGSATASPSDAGGTEQLLYISDFSTGWESASSPYSQTTTSSENFTISWIDCVVKPTYQAKNTNGVTSDGAIEFAKSPTTAQVEFSELKSISKVVVKGSTTGNNRGFGIYKKVAGSDWSLINEYLITGAGESNTIDINEENVAFKLMLPVGNANYFYLHDIEIYGYSEAAAPPSIEGITPENKSVIPVSGSFQVNFTEPVKRVEGVDITIGDITITEDGISVNKNSATITYSGLSTDRSYEMKIPKGAFVNEAGTPTAIDYIYSFDTPDTKLPEITNNPATAYGILPSNGFMTITYSEQVKIGTSPVRIGDKEITPSMSGSSNLVYIKYSGLDYSSSYEVTIPENAILDVQGNSAVETKFEISTEGNYKDNEPAISFIPSADNITASSSEFISGGYTVEITGINSAAPRNKDGYTYAFRATMLTFPSIESIGELYLHIQNGSGSDAQTYSIEKKSGDNWVKIDEFTLGGNDAARLTSAAAQSSEASEIRFVASGPCWFYDISVSKFLDRDAAEDDGLAPSVVSSKPTDSQIGVSINGTIELNMSKSVYAGSGSFILNGKTIRPNIIGKTVRLNYNNLSYASSYELIWTEGALVDKYGRELAGGSITFVTVDKPVVNARLFDFIVAQDGSGDGLTIQSAFEAATAGVNSYLIFVKDGEYDFDSDGYASLAAGKTNVSLIGQSRDGVILKGSRKSQTGSTGLIDYGTSNCQTLEILADNFYCENITIENVKNGELASLGVALKVYADKAVFKNVRLLGYQDTHLTSNKGTDRQYYLDCEIHGTVDFIFGDGICYFDNNVISVDARPNGSTTGNCITAAATSAGNSFGYVFNNCTIDGTSTQDGVYTLGRPWKNSPQVAYLNTTMNILPTSAGWGDMPGNNPTPLVMAEYNSVNGAGHSVDLSNRKSVYQRQDDGDWSAKNIISEEESASYSVENVLGGSDNWNARAKAETTAAPKNAILISMDNTLRWEPVDGAICYIIIVDGKFVRQTTECIIPADDNVKGDVIEIIAVSESGSLSLPTEANVTTSIDNNRADNADNWLKSTTATSEFSLNIKADNIDVISLQGQTIANSVNSDRINVESLQNGVYIIRITHKGETSINKVVKR